MFDYSQTSTHWVLFISREKFKYQGKGSSDFQYIASYDVETPPIYLQKYIHLVVDDKRNQMVNLSVVLFVKKLLFVCFCILIMSLST